MQNDFDAMDFLDEFEISEPVNVGIVQETASDSNEQDLGLNFEMIHTMGKLHEEKKEKRKKPWINKSKHAKTADNRNGKKSDSASEPQDSTTKPHFSIKKNAANKKLVIKSTQIFSPIRDVRDGIIVLKTGEFCKVLEFSPINFMLRSSFEQEVIISEYMQLVKILPTNTQFKILSRTADIEDFVDRIKEDQDTEENANCRLLQSGQVDLIRRLGRHQAVSRRFFIIFKYEAPAFTSSKKFSWFDVVNELETQANRIINSMHRIGNEVLSIDGDDNYTLELLYDIFCRTKSVSVPYEDRLEDTIAKAIFDVENEDQEQYIPINDIICPDYISTKKKKYIEIDGLFYAFAYIPSRSYPDVIDAGWINLFSNLGAGIDVDLFACKQDSHSTQIKLQYALRYNKVNARDKEDTSLDYEDMMQTINSGYYLKSGLSAGDDFIYMAALITVTANSPELLLAKCEEIKKFAFSIDFPVKFCDYQHEEAFLSTLPTCSIDKNLFAKAKRNILGQDFASSYPFSSFEICDRDGIMLGLNKSNRSLAIIDNFDSNKYANANMCIMGMSGAGKTFMLIVMAMRMRQKKIQTFIIAPDKGHEFKRSCDAIGGQYIKIAPGSSQNINIMEIRKMDTSATQALDGEDQSSILAAKILQLHVFFSLLIPDMTHEEKQLLDEGFIKTYAKFGITADNSSLIDPYDKTKYRQMPILSDVHATLLEMGDRTQHLTTVLTRYVTGSASTFNGETNVDLNNKYIVLDVSSLTKDMLPIGMFIALDYVWDKAREDRTKRKAIFVDEAWQLIGAGATTSSAEFVLEIFKVIRGYGGAAIAATQDITDFFALDDGHYGKAIINNSKIKMIMKMETQEAKTVQNILDLSDGEIEECVRFERGSCILAANSDHVLVDFVASDYETALVTTDRQLLEKQVETRKNQ